MYHPQNRWWKFISMTLVRIPTSWMIGKFSSRRLQIGRSWPFQVGKREVSHGELDILPFKISLFSRKWPSNAAAKGSPRILENWPKQHQKQPWIVGGKREKYHLKNLKVILEDSSSKPPLMMRFLVPVVSSFVSYNFRLKSWTPEASKQLHWHLEFRQCKQLLAFNQSIQFPNPPKIYMHHPSIHLTNHSTIIISGSSSLRGVPVSLIKPPCLSTQETKVSKKKFQRIYSPFQPPSRSLLATKAYFGVLEPWKTLGSLENNMENESSEMVGKEFKPSQKHKSFTSYRGAESSISPIFLQSMKIPYQSIKDEGSNSIDLWNQSISSFHPTRFLGLRHPNLRRVMEILSGFP